MRDREEHTYISAHSRGAVVKHTQEHTYSYTHTHPVLFHTYDRSHNSGIGTIRNRSNEAHKATHEGALRDRNMIKIRIRMRIRTSKQEQKQ